MKLSMGSMPLLLCLLCLTTSASAASGNAASVGAEKATPMSKVLTLLDGMLKKAKEEKQQELVVMAQQKTFCGDSQASTSREVQRETRNIDSLTAEIEKLQADIALLTGRMNQDDGDISDAENEMDKDSKARENDHEDYLRTHEDYIQTMDALQRAIATLKKQAVNRPQAALTQVAALTKLDLIPAKAKKSLETFLMQDEPEEVDEDDLFAEYTAPEANAYEFGSTHIIGMLEKLADKFYEEKQQLEHEEAQARHEFDVEMLNLKGQVSIASKDKTEKQATRSAKTQDKAVDKEAKKGEQSMYKVDSKSLSDITADCSQEEKDFLQRQALRAEEINALEKAVEILKSKVQGHAENYFPAAAASAALPQTGSALVQMNSLRINPSQERVVEYLKGEADRLNSHVLSSLAVRVQVDPFTKVKRMIKDLVVRLIEEGAEETEHKGWCDTELTRNEQTRSEKASEVDTLKAEVDELQASISKLAEEVTDLTKELQEMAQSLATATKMRSEEKVGNEQTVNDARNAQSAVAQALAVLKEFYAKSGEAEFLQQPYTPMVDASQGVIGMIEVIEGDFARLEAETSASEAAAQKQYDEFARGAAVEKAMKSTALEHKAANKQEHEHELVRKKADLEGTEKELETAVTYYDKLKPSCVDASVNYDARVERRKEEVSSLQEALKILDGEDIA